mmetsp:Transcript_38993/g.123959  ORF Transcript_38993/g.123959 Transcript_38993/m.123959 type:complete len:400 (+) Transcript_38993:69-1268(+)
MEWSTSKIARAHVLARLLALQFHGGLLQHPDHLAVQLLPVTAHGKVRGGCVGKVDVGVAARPRGDGVQHHVHLQRVGGALLLQEGADALLQQLAGELRRQLLHAEPEEALHLAVPPLPLALLRGLLGRLLAGLGQLPLDLVPVQHLFDLGVLAQVIDTLPLLVDFVGLRLQFQEPGHRLSLLHGDRLHQHRVALSVACLHVCLILQQPVEDRHLPEVHRERERRPEVHVRLPHQHLPHGVDLAAENLCPHLRGRGDQRLRIVAALLHRHRRSDLLPLRDAARGRGRRLLLRLLGVGGRRRRRLLGLRLARAARRRGPRGLPLLRGGVVLPVGHQLLRRRRDFQHRADGLQLPLDHGQDEGRPLAGVGRIHVGLVGDQSVDGLGQAVGAGNHQGRVLVSV